MFKNSLIALKKTEFYLAFFIVIFIQALLSFQGFDMCDEGFSLTFYQQLYHDPSSVEYCFVYWLSGIVGGLWYHLYPEGGILWFRILAIIFNTATFILGYKILKGYIKSPYILIGLSMVLFVNDYGYLAFYHNHLTAFLAVLSIYFLHLGLVKEQYFLLLFSGFLIGINVFTRLPNITLFIFILAIPYATYLNHQKIVKAVKPMLFFILGTVTGLISIFVLLFGLGQIEIMKEALFVLGNLGEAKDSGHNIISLLNNYISNHIKVVTLFCKFLIICLFLFSFENYYKNNKIIKGIIILFGFIVFALLFKKGGIHMVYGLGYVGVLGTLLIKQNEKPIKIVALLAFLMMLFLPLGSGGSINSSGYMCIWLALPFFLHFMLTIKSSTFNLETKYAIISSHISKDFFKQLSIVLVLAFFTAKAYSISQEAYFDPGSRFKKTYKINSKYAQGIYTTKERATVINDLLTNLEKYVKPGDYILAYDNIPMIHFLTETKPYMYNPWVMIYDQYSFETQMERAEKEISVLPVVVQQKFSTIIEFSDPILNYMSETKENNNEYNKGRTTAMNKFLKNHDYKIVWSNDYFNIYKSNDNPY